jgi:hypothetical protein
MSANPKFFRLLKGLLEATRSGRVSWDPTVSDTDFRVQLEGVMVRVGLGYLSETDADEGSPSIPYATLIGPGGKILERGWSEELEPEQSDLIRDLYDAARRQVLRVDDVLDRLIQQVESGKTAWKAS